MIDGPRFREGDPRHFEEVVRRFGPLVLRVVESFAGDPDHCEDLFQEVWRRAFEKRRSYAGGSFEAWLHRLATNLCVTEFRARRVRSSKLRRFMTDGIGEAWAWRPTDPLSGMARQEFHARLHRALARLTDREHQAILLRVLEGRPPAEVARIMGVTKATVRSLIRHAVERLRDMMEDPREELSRYRSAP